MSFIQKLATSVSRLLNKAPKVADKEIPEMRQTVVRLAHAYTPMIKFVGGKHEIVKHQGAVKGHPCAVDGLKPGSQDCVSAGEFLSKLKPFQVVPYHGGASRGASGSAAATGKSPAATDKNKSRYVFQNRPLKDNEVGSIAELPSRFRGRPISDLEAEAINGGGAI